MNLLIAVLSVCHLVVIAPLILGLSAPLKAPDDPPVQTISIDNFKFGPESLTITTGANVTWTNQDDVPHTVTSSDDPPVFDSKAIDTDGTFSFTFSNPGVYHYYCKLHRHMTGTITVK